MVYLRELQEEVASEDVQNFIGLCGIISGDTYEEDPATTLLCSIIKHTCDKARCVFVTTAFRIIPSLQRFYKGEERSYINWITSRIEWLESLKGLAEEA